MPATVWRGRLAFGLVSVPVRLYKAARRERTRFHNVYRPPDEEPVPPPEPHGRVREFPRPALAPAIEESEPADELTSAPVVRVRNAPLVETSQLPVPRQSILKGYESGKDQYVVLAPEEISALRPKTSTSVDIVEFVRIDEIDPLFFDVAYYVAPEKGGEKAYAILFEALKKTGYVALGTLAMHGREHAVVIRPGKHGLILHTLFHANEVRAEDEWRTEANLVGEKELELANLLVSAMHAKFEPEKLKDGFEERLRGLIESRTPTTLASSERTPETKKAPVVDIMDALRRSLEAARKPVTPQGRTKTPPKHKRG